MILVLAVGRALRILRFLSEKIIQIKVSREGFEGTNCDGQVGKKAGAQLPITNCDQ